MLDGSQTSSPAGRALLQLVLDARNTLLQAVLVAGRALLQLVLVAGSALLQVIICDALWLADFLPCCFEPYNSLLLFFSNLIIPACALDKGNIEGPISERSVVLQEDFKVRKWPQSREPAAKYVCSYR